MKMKYELVDKVKAYCMEQHLLNAGDRIVVGVSGGADSVCLFYVLLELCREIPFDFRVVHVHHGIRKEADQDQAYVEKICREAGISCTVFREDIPQLVRESGMSEEEAGRKVRYEDFRKVLADWQKESEKESEKDRNHTYRIATAHHKNDQAETVLFQLFRGTGLTGLGGIRPEKGQIIRPMLCLRKDEMEQYLGERHIPFCIDQTNAEEVYARNRIRNRLLPEAESICHGAVEHIARTAAIVQEAEQFLMTMIRTGYGDAAAELSDQQRVGSVTKIRAVSLDLLKMEKLDPYLQKEILRYALLRVTSARKDISAGHIEEMFALLKGTKNGKLMLPYRWTAERSYQFFNLYQDKEDQIRLFCHCMHYPEAFYRKEAPKLLIDEAALLSSQDRDQLVQKSKEEPDTIYLDADKITATLSMRHRQPEDYLIISQKGEKKRLKEYLIEQKMPKELRDRAWLLADAENVVWVPGYRMNQKYVLSEHTKKVLRISIE